MFTKEELIYLVLYYGIENISHNTNVSKEALRKLIKKITKIGLVKI